MGTFDDIVEARKAEREAKEQAEANEGVEKVRRERVEAERVPEYVEKHLKPILRDYVAAARQTGAKTHTFEANGESSRVSGGYLVGMQYINHGTKAECRRGWFMDENLRFWGGSSSGLKSAEDFFRCFAQGFGSTCDPETRAAELDEQFIKQLKDCL